MNKAEELLHVAACQAVAILNAAPELARIAEGRQVRDILRTALAEYAEAVMDEPVQPGEIEHMKKLHRRGRASNGVMASHAPADPQRNLDMWVTVNVAVEDPGKFHTPVIHWHPNETAARKAAAGYQKARAMRLTVNPDTLNITASDGVGVPGGHTFSGRTPIPGKEP